MGATWMKKLNALRENKTKSAETEEKNDVHSN